MPQVNLADLGFDARSPWVSNLPTAAQLAAPDAYGATQWAQAYTAALGRYAAHALGREALRHGFLADRLPALRSYADVAWGSAELVADIVRAFRSGQPWRAVSGALVKVQQLLQQAGVLQSAPVVGWAIGVAKTVWSAIEAGLAEWKDPAPVVTYARLEYDPDADGQLCNGALDLIDGEDWTPLYLPLAVGPVVPHLVERREAPTVPGSPWGKAFSSDTKIYRLAPDDPEPNPVATGWLPGSDVCARAWEVRDDFIRGSHNVSVPTGFSYWHPAYSGAQSSLWAYLLRPGPTMFRLDTRVMDEQWEAFWQAWLAAASQSQNVVLAHAAGTVYRTALGAAVGAPTRYQETLTIPGGGFHRTITARGLTRWKVDDLRERQKNALDTLAVAYLAETFAALRDPELKALWEERRVQLLAHPARFQVELAMVPDSPWRSALVASRKAVGGGIVSPSLAPGASTAQFTGPTRAEAPPTLLTTTKPGGSPVALLALLLAFV